ncbi:hypothetical protein [Sphaerisporangium sp. NPDC051011]|uniref:hypothetical protein n=1 Tax=Sphaerisporangium sp. NPDC051011 TaxID=3155792 RepID=UPI0033FAA680
MKSRKWAAALGGAALLAVALPGGTAYAIPSTCSTWVSSGGYVNSLCESGTGEHQVYLVARHVNPQVGVLTNEGPWVPVGSISTARIPATGTLQSYGVRLR